MGKFDALAPEKTERAKENIALNRFKDGEHKCDDVEIKCVLWYYKMTRNDAENGIFSLILKAMVSPRLV